MPTYKVRAYELVTHIQIYTTTVEAEDKFYAKEIVAEQYADGTSLDKWTAHKDYDIEDAELMEHRIELEEVETNQ